jgi:hypothetical protein
MVPLKRKGRRRGSSSNGFGFFWEKKILQNFGTSKK